MRFRATFWRAAVPILTAVWLHVGAAPVLAEETPASQLLARALAGYARALDIGTSLDPRVTDIPSTKGSLYFRTMC